MWTVRLRRPCLTAAALTLSSTSLASAACLNQHRQNICTTPSPDGPVLECYYSLSSPWMYLGGPALEDVRRRHRVRLLLKPYDFQAVAPKSGGVPLKTRPEARKTYHASELERWSSYLGIPLNLQPKHYKPNFATKEAPADPLWNKRAGWMVIAAQNRGEDAFALSHALLRALWAEDRDISDPEVRVAVANENGYDGAALLALETAPETQATYDQYTQEALAKGVFGSPTYVTSDGERFWGQDRLLFVDRKLDRMRHEAMMLGQI